MSSPLLKVSLLSNVNTFSYFVTKVPHAFYCYVNPTCIREFLLAGTE